jgi:hypothetical protein
MGFHFRPPVWLLEDAGVFFAVIYAAAAEGAFRPVNLGLVVIIQRDSLHDAVLHAFAAAHASAFIYCNRHVFFLSVGYYDMDMRKYTDPNTRIFFLIVISGNLRAEMLKKSLFLRPGP